jgi:hypothetical protein
MADDGKEEVVLDEASTKSLVDKVVEALGKTKGAPKIEDLSDEQVAGLTDAIDQYLQEKLAAQPPATPPPATTPPPAAPPSPPPAQKTMSPEEIAALQAELKTLKEKKPQGTGNAIVEPPPEQPPELSVRDQILAEMREHPHEALAEFFKVANEEKKKES